MDTTEFKDFLKRAGLLLSSLTKRRSSKILIMDEKTWIFSNLVYKYDKKKDKWEDEFYDFHPQVHNQCHLVEFCDNFFDDIRNLFKQCVENNQQPMIIATDLYGVFNREVKKYKEWSSINFDVQTHRKRVFLNVYFDEKSVPSITQQIGYIFDIRRTLSLYNNMIENIKVFNKSDITRRHLRLEDIKTDEKYKILTMVPMELDKDDNGVVKVPLVDGATNVSLLEYCKKIDSDSDWELSVNLWKIGKYTWDSLYLFTDNHLTVYSYPPGIYHFVSTKNNQNKENNDD